MSDVKMLKWALWLQSFSFGLLNFHFNVCLNHSFWSPLVWPMGQTVCSGYSGYREMIRRLYEKNLKLWHSCCPRKQKLTTIDRCCVAVYQICTSSVVDLFFFLNSIITYNKVLLTYIIVLFSIVKHWKFLGKQPNYLKNWEPCIF